MQTIHPFQPAAPETSRARADELIAWLRRYGETRIDSVLWDERRCVPPYVILDFGNRGLFGMQVPEAHGGLALNNRDFLRVLQQLAAIDISLASLVFIHNGNGVRPILGYARPELRDALLPVLAQGRELSAYGLTEPAAGSNLPGLQTRAVPAGPGRWKLYGVKRWNASGWAGIFTVFARLVDDRGRLGHVAAFVLRQDMPGLRFGPESLTMGVRAIMQNSLILDGVEVDEANLLGTPERGMEIADEALLIARLCMGAIASGGMKKCAQLMLRYAERREVSTGRLIDSPVTLDAMSEVTRRIAAVDALVDRLVGTLDAGRYPAEEACMVAKILASDYLWQTADDCVQLLGGRGFMENNPGPMILRDCRMLRIGEGANELMTLSIGRRVKHSRAFRAFVAEDLDCPDLELQMQEAAAAAMERVLAPGAGFADRSAAVAWGQTLAGRVAVATVQQAALAAATAATPEEREGLAHARAWAEARRRAAVRAAVEGDVREATRRDARAIRAAVAGFATEIGDLEQAPPGVERAVDPMLSRDGDAAGPPGFDHLPGNARPDDAAPDAAPPAADLVEAEEKRRRVAALLKRRLAPSDL
jgi:alkylation response protein AidB-like acyl-CoA dehydrogenase